MEAAISRDQALFHVVISVVVVFGENVVMGRGESSQMSSP